jgi:hypothetical protein
MQRQPAPTFGFICFGLKLESIVTALKVGRYEALIYDSPRI